MSPNGINNVHNKRNNSSNDIIHEHSSDTSNIANPTAKHLQNYKEVDGQIVYNTCDNAFDQMGDFLLHISNCEKQCLRCHRMYPTKEALLEHMPMHTSKYNLCFGKNSAIYAITKTENFRYFLFNRWSMKFYCLSLELIEV